jgi:hypothetical protein
MNVRTETEHANHIWWWMSGTEAEHTNHIW